MMRVKSFLQVTPLAEEWFYREFDALSQKTTTDMFTACSSPFAIEGCLYLPVLY